MDWLTRLRDSMIAVEKRMWGPFIDGSIGYQFWMLGFLTDEEVTRLALVLRMTDDPNPTNDSNES